MNSNPLKIGLLVDSTHASKYVFDLAEWGQNRSDLEISHLIIQELSPVGTGAFGKIAGSFKKYGLTASLEKMGFVLIQKIESLLLQRIKKYHPHFRTYDLTSCVKQTISIKPLISKSGFIYRYDDNEIQKIKKLGLDVVIRCGSGILRGDILQVARFGILSFHHADNNINRGGPPAFWEVFLKQDSTGFTIQQLTEELDGGNVLFQGRFPTRSFYLLNKSALYEKSNFYLKKILTDIAITNTLPEKLESFPYFNPLYKRPNLYIQSVYITSMALVAFKLVLNRFLFRKTSRWSVAFNFSDWRNLVMWRSIKIKNPANHFLADPFVVQHQNENYCFVEDYDYLAAKGTIAVYKLHAKEAVRMGEAVVEPFHLSYPYVFEYDSKFYMCPDTSGTNDIRIYECENFPLQWKLKQIVMPDVSAADTMIFEKDGIWWLFTNIDPVHYGDHCSELFIYYADTPLTDRWTPHPKNPIVVDSTRARNAGVLFDGNSLYRVSQQQEFGRYGKATLINKIIHLSKTDYREDTVFKIEPNFFNGIKGTHHMHSNGKVTVFDFVEDVKTHF